MSSFSVKGLEVADEGYSLECEPLSLGQGDGQLRARPDLGKSTVQGRRCLCGVLRFSLVDCRNRLGAVGSGQGEITCSQAAATDGRRAYLRDGDSGLCTGQLMGRSDQLPGSCACRWTVRVAARERATNLDKQQPTAEPVADPTRDEEQLVELVYDPRAREVIALTAAEVCLLENEALVAKTLREQFWRAEDSGDRARAEQMRKLLEKHIAGPGSTSDLTEIHRIGKGFKTAYVRTKVLQRWIRRASLANEPRKRRMTKDGKLDWRQIKKELTQPKTKVKVGWDKQFERHLDGWIKHRSSRNYEASAGATLLRYLVAGSTSLDVDFRKRRLSMLLDGSVSQSLFDGAARIEGYLPHAIGWHAASSSAVGRVDLGHFRLAAGARIELFAGAALVSSLKLDASARDPGASVELSGSAFLGAKATARFELALEWQEPSGTSSVTGFEKLASGAVAATGAGGIGAEGRAWIAYDSKRGRFVVCARGGVVFGLGGGATLEFVLEGNHIGRLLACIVRNLRALDYGRLGDLSTEAFEAVCGALLQRIAEVQKTGEAILEVGDHARRWWLDRLAARERIEALAERVLAHTDVLADAPPELKGRLLDALAARSRLSREERQEDAILSILHTIRTPREYRLVLERMTPGPDRVDVAASERRLADILDGRQWGEFLQWRMTLRALGGVAMQGGSDHGTR